MPRPASGAAPSLVLAMGLAACGGASPTPEASGLSLSPEKYAEPGLHDITLTVDELERTYSLYVPTAYDRDTPTPMVLAFHGRTMSRLQMIGSWSGLADEHGFLVAAPDGIDGEWAVAHDADEAAAALPNSQAFLSVEAVGDRDVAFAAAVLADVAEYLYVDSDRVFVTGVSLGGFMASRVACEIGEHFAALGPTLNSLLYSEPCPTAASFAVLSAGHALDRTHSLTDANAAADAWARHNGCDSARDEVTAAGEDVTVVTYAGCPDATPVKMLVHRYAWAGHDAERAVWEFFSSLN